MYSLSTKLTNEVDNVRHVVADFINCNSDEIIFTSGATDSFNKLTYMLAFSLLKDGDEILYSPYDHTSLTLPWFRSKELLEKFEVNIKLIEYKIRNTGGADIKDILSKVTERTRVINISQINNIFGSDSDIVELKYLRAQNIFINVDASQSIGHMIVDMKEIGADAISFSGHKVFASQGVVILALDKKWHKNLKPLILGGGEGSSIKKDAVIIDNFVKSIESGTLNYAGILSLGKAIEYINSIGIEEIHLYLADLTQYLLYKLKDLPNIEFTYGPYYWRCYDGFGIISFDIKNMDSTEVGFILSENNILVRTGTHCSTTKDINTNSIRISMHIYNTKDEIDKLIEVLKRIL